ncbi:MAG: nucleotidyltransferase family protein [Anaerolineaceae bacterium]|nr:nucleotidyltransferase family protein [Anaerolineaceae bacterium]
MGDRTRDPLTLDELRTHRDAIVALAERYGAYNVRVFGSVARGESTPDSDVDLLITARKGVTMFDLVGLWLDLQELLECEVSLTTDDEIPRHERFMQRVRKDAVPL